MLTKRFNEVPVEKLRWSCPVERLRFKTTENLKPLEKIIGQDRALKAIKLGLDVESIGYNIFITGLVGTGRKTTIKSLLTGLKEKEKFIPGDIVYVHNFKDPDQPKTITLKNGQGKKLANEMNEFMQTLKRTIPVILESDDFQNKRKAIIEGFRSKEKVIISKFENTVNKENFVLIQVQMGPFTKPDIMPVFEGNPIDFDQLEKKIAEGKITKEKVKKLREKYEELSREMEKVLKRTKVLEKEVKKELKKLETNFIMPLIKTSIQEVKKNFTNPAISDYMEATMEDLILNIHQFTEKTPKQDMAFAQMPKDDPFIKYSVNVLVDNSEAKGRPIILEAFPTYKNLFGTIERVLDRAGGIQTDHTKIKAGSFLKANGGYLVINAMDALIEPGVWTALKRTLKNRMVEIQNYEPFYLFSSTALKPEPIEANVKVVLVGDDFLYHMLWNWDEDFKKIFKIKADFDTEADRDEEMVHHYASFIKKICDEEKLKAFDRSAVARIIEFAVRLAGRKKKISTMFSNVADLIREANYFAAKSDSRLVSGVHVDKAIDEKVSRVNLVESKIKEYIDDDIILIDSKGAKTGQVNGLAVYNLGDYTFGKPSRITAKVSLGRAGVINIEREADMGGKTYNKGVLILTGYLRSKYSQSRPMNMSASICFEQSYGEIDGDSASSTELYAIMSALSDIPLRQDIAVTGSLNQNGEVQAIGGVNEKIEGFFDVCKTKGLSGSQGVMIPESNVDDLMLRKDIVESVKNGKFHIYSVKHAEEGIEILTGIKAGKMLSNGSFEKGSINDVISKKLDDMAKKMKEFGQTEKNEKSEKGDRKEDK